MVFSGLSWLWRTKVRGLSALVGNVPDDLGPAGQRREVAEPDIEARRFDDGDRRNSRDSSRVAVTRTGDEYRALM